MEPTPDLSSLPASASANASLTTPVQASQLAKGDFILIKSHPCKILSKSTSKPGKHGHAKVNFEALALLSPFKKHTDIHPAHATVAAPIVKLTSYLLLDVNEGFLSLWDQHAGRVKDDVKAPPGAEGEVGAKLERVWEKEGKGEGGEEVWVTVLATMGVEVVRDVEAVVG
ncbi:MAG: hypothetical protein Q9184_005823 [Pyrenodesmia sp. 2 TL-2023]